MAKEYAEQDGSPDLLATVHHNLACAQIDLQKWAEMDWNFKACIDIYDPLGNVDNRRSRGAKPGLSLIFTSDLRTINTSQNVV
jgi:hypothetical protein